MTLCRAPETCRAKTPGKHCKSCVASARWADPAHRETAGAKISAGIAAKPRKPFKDELRTRRAVLYASAFGLERAGEMLGICPTKISLWRSRLERIEGKIYPRLTRTPKLDLEKARDICAQLAAGEKLEYLAHVYGVGITTISKVGRGLLYPEAKRQHDIATWNALGNRRAA